MMIKTQKFIKLCLLSLLVFIAANMSAQTTYYVKSGGTGNGSSWDNPLGALPTLAGDNLNSVHIYIAEGNYTLANTYIYEGGDVLIQGGGLLIRLV